MNNLLRLLVCVVALGSLNSIGRPGVSTREGRIAFAGIPEGGNHNFCTSIHPCAMAVAMPENMNQPEARELLEPDIQWRLRE